MTNRSDPALMRAIDRDKARYSYAAAKRPPPSTWNDTDEAWVEFCQGYGDFYRRRAGITGMRGILPLNPHGLDDKGEQQ